MFENGTINSTGEFWTAMTGLVVFGVAFFAVVRAGINKIMKRK